MTASTARPLPGGPLAIDLLNTTWRTGNGPVDWFDDDAAVIDFAREYDHDLQARDVVAARAAFVESRQLTRRLFETAPGAHSDLIAEVNAVLESARVVVSSTNDALTLDLRGAQPHTGLAIEALVNAVELQRDRSGRVRSCEHESCVLWFVDTSKGGRRRWCSMERCGNRAKAKRHYDRSAQSAN